MKNDKPGHDYRIDTPETIRVILNKMAVLLSQVLPEGWGFALLLFNFGGEGKVDDGTPQQVAYVSNARREDILSVMEEFKQKQGN